MDSREIELGGQRRRGQGAETECAEIEAVLERSWAEFEILATQLNDLLHSCKMVLLDLLKNLCKENLVVTIE
jgi:hypothetical protein